MVSYLITLVKIKQRASSQLPESLNCGLTEYQLAILQLIKRHHRIVSAQYPGHYCEQYDYQLVRIQPISSLLRLKVLNQDFEVQIFLDSLNQLAELIVENHEITRAEAESKCLQLDQQGKLPVIMYEAKRQLLWHQKSDLLVTPYTIDGVNHILVVANLHTEPTGTTMRPITTEDVGKIKIVCDPHQTILRKLLIYNGETGQIINAHGKLIASNILLHKYLFGYDLKVSSTEMASPETPAKRPRVH